jgi:hypothetical protein
MEVAPYAVYAIDGKPFVLFFEDVANSEKFKYINKQIWNTQIPIVIFCGVDSVKIYNGCSLDMSTLLLNVVLEQSVDACSVSSPFSYWEISDPNFWNLYTKQYSSIKLNEMLLGNIEYITTELKSAYGVPFATKLVLRIIFIRYLIDRGVDLDYGNFSGDVNSSKAELLAILRDKQSIYNLFAHLKEKFNGNLFDLGAELNDAHLSPDVFNLLADFLSGKENLSNHQLALFELYDFNIIPVEIISNIYEILLGKEKQSRDNAFYTPNYLVEYMLDMTVTPFLKQKEQCAILDPACGSGVFLVDSYRRMVEKNLNGTLYSDNDTMLKELLKKNIYGIDINEEAIDVAIFSLYLTVLDYKDPRTLVQFSLPNLKNINLFVGDFFDDHKLQPLKEIKFDFILGNPPWGNVKTGLHMQYCKEYGHENRQQNSEISRSFVFRAHDFSCEDTQCCFILHSKLLYNQKKPARNFREFLLLNTEISKVLEMSSVRKLVFKNADAPAVVLMFKYSKTDCSQNKITYISLKPNIFFKLFNIIVIERNDIKYIKQNLLIQSDWAWKTIVFGLSGDLDILIALKKNYETVEMALESQSPQLVTGEGVQYLDGDKKDASHLLGMPMLDSQKGVEHFIVNSSNTTIFEKREIHRPRDKRLFQPPYCITARGLDCTDYTMRSAYSEETFICKHAIYIIKGNPHNKNFLLNLVGLFNSSFFAYLNLMLGSSVGIEREQRSTQEIFKFPYIYDDAISSQVEHIQKLKNKFTLGDSYDIEDEIKKLNAMIIDKFDLYDNVFVDYALNIQIPQLTGVSDGAIYRNATEEDLLKYSKCFDEYFSLIYGKSSKYISITLYPQIASRYTIFELSVNEIKPTKKIKVSNIIDSNIAALSKFSVFKTNDLFYQIRDVAYFGESSFFIIKPNHYKNWHPAIAKLDLMDIIDQILSKPGGDQ